MFMIPASHSVRLGGMTQWRSPTTQHPSECPTSLVCFAFFLGLYIDHTMPPSRFGASKFRNTTPVIPGRDEWYRTHLPQASSSNSTSSSTSTFSSEVKSSRRWIVTVSPSGEVSWRVYSTTSGQEGGVGSMKVGSVGDWDISGLEDETLVIGGTDGTVGPYLVPSGSLPSHSPDTGRRGSDRHAGDCV